MKHHKFSQGWRDANQMTPREILSEAVGVAVVFAIVIVVVAIVAHHLAR